MLRSVILLANRMNVVMLRRRRQTITVLCTVTAFMLLLIYYYRGSYTSVNFHKESHSNVSHQPKSGAAQLLVNQKDMQIDSIQLKIQNHDYRLIQQKLSTPLNQELISQKPAFNQQFTRHSHIHPKQQLRMHDIASQKIQKEQLKKNSTTSDSQMLLRAKASELLVFRTRVKKMPKTFPSLMPLTNFTDTIVILTPVSNVEKKLSRYFNIIQNFTYPKHLISIALGEDTSSDKTFLTAKDLLANLHGYRRKDLFHFSDRHVSGHDWETVHRYSNQKPRRAHMAQSRNHLLFSGLKDETWVLWIDSDITSAPADLIQQLLTARKNIVVPSCLYVNNKGEKRVYDKNTWRETKESQKYLKRKKDDFLMLEGYNGPSKRLFLLNLRNEGPLVRLNGVGGCVLLVKANIHRQGLIFPTFVFDHHIETEGLAKMATKMGHSIYGMPFVEVFH